MSEIDWRLPEHRRELFQRSYTHSLTYNSFPGMVYSMLPAVATAFDLDEDGRAWLAWLNGNTQNVVTSMLLLEAAPSWRDWRKAIEFWDDHFRELEWDTDRRHQKNRFADATELWVARLVDEADTPASTWANMSGRDSFRYAMSLPYMGRISAWSYMEFARILLPGIPDVDGWYLKESSSRSHRNALCLLSGHEGAWGWDGDQSELPALLGLFEELDELAEDLLEEARGRNRIDVVCDACHGMGCGDCMGVGMWDGGPKLNVSRLTMESALCTFKSWHKPNRRYPNVYADMMYGRIKKAEARLDRHLDLLWEIRQETLPARYRLEDMMYDPGLVPVKQNWFRETGEVHYLHDLFPDMEPSGFELAVDSAEYGARKDPKWTL